MTIRMQHEKHGWHEAMPHEVSGMEKNGWQKCQPIPQEVCSGTIPIEKQEEVKELVSLPEKRKPGRPKKLVGSANGVSSNSH